MEMKYWKKIAEKVKVSRSLWSAHNHITQAMDGRTTSSKARQPNYKTDGQTGRQTDHQSVPQKHSRYLFWGKVAKPARQTISIRKIPQHFKKRSVCRRNSLSDTVRSITFDDDKEKTRDEILRRKFIHNFLLWSFCFLSWLKLS